MSDTNERSVASAGSHGDAIRSAALALYEAGRWVSVDVPREKADAMWATLRDALGLRPGHATARGVNDAADWLRHAIAADRIKIARLESEVARLRLTFEERQAMMRAMYRVVGADSEIFWSLLERTK